MTLKCLAALRCNGIGIGVEETARKFDRAILSFLLAGKRRAPIFAVIFAKGSNARSRGGGEDSVNKTHLMKRDGGGSCRQLPSSIVFRSARIADFASLAILPSLSAKLISNSSHSISSRPDPGFSARRDREKEREKERTACRYTYTTGRNQVTAASPFTCNL